MTVNISNIDSIFYNNWRCMELTICRRYPFQLIASD